ncbi:mucin [Salpingoeca rosetta]|uniref:Mucin n=1 Tax=Salpingoeca rosetta (strain ATCC 50818 / BSB-021) TaxID=946362 RepID=F2UQX3_SALR5|nr:mucin [Salpingoeca rosetta]EGD80028.1 mucin [Salpingoeca rosetta]|eukprot:XP_004988353.1 mucin [Salpingoeca rosetta]
MSARATTALALAIAMVLLASSVVIHALGAESRSPHDDDVAINATQVASLDFGVSDMALALAHPHHVHHIHHNGTANSSSSSTLEAPIAFISGGCIQQEWINASYPGYYCTSVLTEVYAFLAAVGNERIIKTWSAPSNRYRHASVIVGSNLFLIGGRNFDDGIVTTMDILDFHTGIWTSVPSDLALSDHAAFVLNDTIYVVGGYDATYTAQSKMYQLVNYTVNGTTFAEVAGGDLTVARGDLSVTTVNSTVYAVGGFTHANSFTDPLPVVESWLPASGKGWRREPDLPSGRGDKVALNSHNHLVVIGGETRHPNNSAHSVPVDDVDVFNPLTSQWTHLGHVSFPRFRFAAASVGHYVYLFGGQGELVGEHGTNWSYYPTLNSIERFHLPLPHPHADEPHVGTTSMPVNVTTAATASMPVNVTTTSMSVNLTTAATASMPVNVSTTAMPVNVTTTSMPVNLTTAATASMPVNVTTTSMPVNVTTTSMPVNLTTAATASMPVNVTTTSMPVNVSTTAMPVNVTTTSMPVNLTTAATASMPVNVSTTSMPVNVTTTSMPVNLTTAATASMPVNVSTTSMPVNVSTTAMPVNVTTTSMPVNLTTAPQHRCQST